MYGLLVYDDVGAARNRWFIEHLTEYARQRGEELRFVRAADLPFGTDQTKRFMVFPDGRTPDYAIVRTIFPLLSESLEALGIRVFNNALISRIANDKRLTQAFAAGHGIASARTWFLQKSAFDPASFRYPLVLKSASGHGGNEVFYVENPKNASRAVEKIEGGDFLVQEVVDKGRDVRVYTLGKSILAAVERVSDVDFRSNYSLGGRCALFKPDETMKNVVRTLCEALEPTFLGIDFTFRNGVPLLNEIEDVVGARMLYALTDLQVHRRFFDEILSEMNGGL